MSKFITFEGGEGTGKSTQVKLLAEALTKADIDSVSTREPGGAPGAEDIRNLLVNGDVDRWSPMSEALLNYAARAEHLEHTVVPALESGKWVISDRFVDSTTAYQGYGHGLEIDQIETIYKAVLSSFNTDLTIILDLDTEAGLSRAISRSEGEDRYERMEIEFHQRLRQGFLKIAKNAPDRCCVVDASGDADTVFDQIRTVVQDRLKV